MKSRLLVAGTILLVAACGPAAEPLPVPDQIVAGEIQPTRHRLQHLALAPDGFVLGAKGAELHRIADGERTDVLHRFGDPIVGIHATATGQIIVSTDSDYRNPATPCRIHISSDGGRGFETTKEINGGCPIWWSIASDKSGHIYLGEYGPKEAAYSKTVWTSADGGRNWSAIFQAPARDGLHIHRVAVDPFTQDLWITTGDGSDNRRVYRSTDGGAHFERLFDSQATAITFTTDNIFFGEDHNKKGRVSRISRNKTEYREVFRASDRGNYGGSVYDMAAGRSGRVYATLVKYPEQDHVASVWAGRDGQWTLLLRLASAPAGSSGSTSIAGPDRESWIYISGYRIRDE